MNIPEEIREFWRLYDEGYIHSNDFTLVTQLLNFVNESNTASYRDKEMYAKLAKCVTHGGFLAREEKKFLINYAILLASHATDYREQMLDSCSILDVWPQQERIRTDHNSGNYRKEFLIWFIRMYEALGNTFLQKRQHSTEYYGIELAWMLEAEKCKMRQDEYGILLPFFLSLDSFVDDNTQPADDYEQSISIMRKLIWKIKQGITRYS